LNTGARQGVGVVLRPRQKAYLSQPWFWRRNALDLQRGDYAGLFARAFCQDKMSFSFSHMKGAAALAVLLALASPALAQSDEDPELRIQRLENQLRQLTGQNEELQYRNRQLEERLRQLQGGAQAAPATAPPGQSNVAVAPPMQLDPGYRQQGAADGGYPQQPQAQPGYGQPQPGYGQQAQPGYGQPQIASPAPIVQEPPAAPAQGRRRGDAFDPNQNPSAPGAPQALGGGRMPMPAEGGAPAGRPPVDMANTGNRAPQGNLPPPAGPGAGGGIATAPPTNSPRDEYDLGIGYMQRKDYALAEQTMRNFAEKYPSDPMIGDSQYWLGESLYQRQQYRDAAEVFLGVSTKHAKSSKAPDALLRLGQSLAALKEKEAACAAFGEVGRKYPRAAAGVKSAVDREQKRVQC
jgi:tol-pal system protein YbgF